MAAPGPPPRRLGGSVTGRAAPTGCRRTGRSVGTCSPTRRSVEQGLEVGAVLRASEPSTFKPFASPAWAAEASLADKASARDLFNEGIALRDKGDAKGALAKFQTAYSLWPSPSTGLELGRTHLVLGELLEARERFLETAQLHQR